MFSSKYISITYDWLVIFMEGMIMRITMIQNVQISELAMPLPLKIYPIF